MTIEEAPTTTPTASLIGGVRHRDFDDAAVLADALRFVELDLLTALYEGEDLVTLVGPVVGDQHVDPLTDRLVGGVAVELLRRRGSSS